MKPATKIKWVAIALLIFLFCEAGRAQQIRLNYVKAFANINHPEIVYWFFAPNMLPEKAYEAEIDTFAKDSKYTMIFLTARDGVNFYDFKEMHPIFKKLVTYAHQKGLKVGLQIWKNDSGTTIQNTERLIQEGEVTLNKKGQANYTVKAKGARNMNNLIKSRLFEIYAFKKTSDGVYDPSTLKIITHLATAHSGRNSVNITIDGGKQLSGYTAYILTQHYYKSCSNYSQQAKTILLNAFKAYGDIPFDAIGLDEYKNLTIARTSTLRKAGDMFNERVYSRGMAKKMKTLTGENLNQVLFNMRYSPQGHPEVRIKAVNEYMSLLRTATLSVEKAMYKTGKQLFGKNTFVGLHNTFHNNLDGDEVWQTGVSWWNIKRDCGFTDEETPAPIQLGIGMCYKSNVMYNMYYNKDLDRIWEKSLYDLRYGIHTLYHAANDINNRWGVSVELPSSLAKINKVENAARLINRFNPPFPDVKLLVIYGMEALFNWYPNLADRGLYDINDKLGMQDKSVELWDHGYLNASVPSDVIEDGRLKLNAAGKPELNGHVFDAIIFLYPQYSKESTLRFLQNYTRQGGKLLIEGKVTRDYDGKNITRFWEKNIAGKAIATSYSLDHVKKLGVLPDTLVDGVSTGGGSFTFTSVKSLQTNIPATFSFTYHGNAFRGSYKGAAAIEVDAEGHLQKLAATSFSSLYKNGKVLLYLDKPADIYLYNKNGIIHATIADSTKLTKLYKD